MGIKVIQEKNQLSKHQIQKIKSKISEYIEKNNESGLESFLNNKILSTIYPENIYNDISYKKEEHYEIYLRKIEKQDLREKLKNHLKTQKMIRRVSSDKESSVWKMYEMLKKHVKRNDIKIPSPTEIKAQMNVFQELLGNIQDKNIKKYIEDCLND